MKDEDLKEFEKNWSSPAGFWQWFSVVNNQPLGARFMVTSMVFFVLAGILALLMRIQLAIPDNTFMGPLVYNQVFTMHGSTMMFLFTVPFLEGLALYVVPLMIGSRDVAFPRLSAFSYWTYLLGGLFFFVSFLTGTAPDAGWFAYTPLSGPKYSGMGVDFWVLGLGLVEVSGISTGIELAVTILKLRSQKMPLNRVPLFVWTILVVSLMIIFAFTVLLVATFLLELDRIVGTRFFDPFHGGNSLLWQHLFWFFGHPEVYIMFLPATGIVSTIISTSARRRLIGHMLVALAVVVTAFVSFGLWVHHMFTTGLPELASSFFTAASLIIATASGVQVFAWIATLWGVRPRYTTPFMFILGFLTIFVLGGLTGVMVAVVPFNWQVHDTYFIVAHFHYVLIGGVVFPIFGAIAYWSPKITGNLMNERIGIRSFWLMFIGFNLTFFPMHLMGLQGMPRRVYTYAESLGISQHNIVSTIGAFIMSLGVLVFIVNFLLSRGKVKKAPGNPWDASTMEWTLSSPPPIYGFLTPPLYQEERGLYRPFTGELNKVQKALTASPVKWRATLVTGTLNGEATAIQWLPGPSYIPFLSALCLLLVLASLLFKLYLLSAAAFIFFAGLIIYWVWPSKNENSKVDTQEIEDLSGLSTSPCGADSPAWWGSVFLIIVIAVVFSALYFSYFYLWLNSSQWPQEDLVLGERRSFVIGVALLVLSALPVLWMKDEIRKGSNRFVFTSVLISTIMGGGSFCVFLFVLNSLSFVPQVNAYASSVHVILWCSLAVIVMGVISLIMLLVRLWGQEPDLRYSIWLQAQVTFLFWFFTVGMIISVGGVLYLIPALLK